MKRFLLAATAAIALLSFSTVAQASSNAKVPHLAGGAADLNNSKFNPGTYSLNVHVLGREISALTIEPQQSIRLSQNIKVFDQSNQPVETTVSMNGQTAMISFAQPVKPDTTLRIEMRNVQNPNVLSTALFSVGGQMVGLGSEISLGTIQMTTHYGRF